MWRAFDKDLDENWVHLLAAMSVTISIRYGRDTLIAMNMFYQNN